MSSIDRSRLKSMENKKISKKEKKLRKERKKDETQGINRKEKKNDERKNKKRKKDRRDEINDDGWIVKKNTKRSKTEAEDIRRYFRTEDKR